MNIPKHIWQEVFDAPEDDGKITVVCSWCNKEIRTIEGGGINGVSHGCCDDCLAVTMAGGFPNIGEVK